MDIPGVIGGHNTDHQQINAFYRYYVPGISGRCGCVAARVPVQPGESECPLHPGEHTAGGTASQVESDRHPSNETADG